MKKATLIILAMLYAQLGLANTSVPLKIKGALLFSPAGDEAFNIIIEGEQKCEESSTAHFKKTACALVKSEALFESSSRKNTVRIYKITEMEELTTLSSGMIRSYALLGEWKATIGGLEVTSPLVISLHEYKDKPKEYIGFVEYTKYAYNKIPLAAKAE